MVLFSWLLLALQVKVVKVVVGKIFVVQCSTTKTTNILPHENYPLYGISAQLALKLWWCCNYIDYGIQTVAEASKMTSPFS